MLNAATSIAGNVPSIFPALGVGSTAVLGPFVMVTVSQDVVFGDLISIGSSSKDAINETMQLGFSIALGFSIIFTVYGFGLAIIAISSSLRNRILGGLDVKRTTVAASFDNEFLHRLYWETRNSTSSTDGLGLALASLFTHVGIAMSFENGWFFSVAGIIFAVMICALFWNISQRNLTFFDGVLTASLSEIS